MAQRTGTPKNSLIPTALEGGPGDKEDADLADEVMTGVRAGAVEVYSAKEICDRLGLGD